MSTWRAWRIWVAEWLRVMCFFFQRSTTRITSMPLVAVPALTSPLWIINPVGFFIVPIYLYFKSAITFEHLYHLSDHLIRKKAFFINYFNFAPAADSTASPTNFNMCLVWCTGIASESGFYTYCKFLNAEPAPAKWTWIWTTTLSAAHKIKSVASASPDIYIVLYQQEIRKVSWAWTCPGTSVSFFSFISSTGVSLRGQSPLSGFLKNAFPHFPGFYVGYKGISAFKL